MQYRGIFDSHAHYDDSAFDEDREEVINELRTEGYSGIVNIGASYNSSIKSLDIANSHDIFYAALGVHPDCICDETLSLDEIINEFRLMAKNNDKVVAVGEIGFDYCHMNSTKEVQKEWFERQLELSIELNMPYVIHSREAEADTEKVLKSYKGKLRPGIMHCYSYSKESAKVYLDMDLYLGIGGVVTFKNARKLVETVEYTPIEKIVLETDCPYLTPVPNRGKRNCSLYIPYIADKIAEIKGMDVEKVIEQTTRNAKEVYGILS